jgi:hypothetical protein
MEHTEPRPQPETFPNPNEGQKVMPQAPETEVNPGEVGNDTEVDLDKEKVKRYPKSNPPETH